MGDNGVERGMIDYLVWQTAGEEHDITGHGDARDQTCPLDTGSSWQTLEFVAPSCASRHVKQLHARVEASHFSKQRGCKTEGSVLV